MKRLLNLSLVILMFVLFTGCDNNNPNTLSLDFKVEGLSLDNEETDSRSQYYSKINSIISDINNHSLYPGHPYLENQETLRSYFNDGVARDDYVLEDEKTLMYSNNSRFIEAMVQSIPYIEQGMRLTFSEESAVSYYGSEFTTYAYDDYVYYSSENDRDESATFEVLVENDNVKSTYFFKSDIETRYKKMISIKGI